MIRNLVQSVVDNVFKDKVTPKIGSVVYCELPFNIESHSGIYIGQNKIVHLNGDGEIELVSPGEFMFRLGGFNTAISIYVSSKNNRTVGNLAVGARARGRIGKPRSYKLFENNCHRFTSQCLLASKSVGNGFHSMSRLKGVTKNVLGVEEWRVWDI